MNRLPANNSFKPNLLRYTKHMAEKACHVFGSTTQVGLTQVLGGRGERMAIRTKKRKQPDTLEQVVLKALESPKYKYRTVYGIARETKIDEGRVRKVLKSSDAVRQSFAKSKTGKQLFASKKKVSVGEDLWTAFRAVNSAKFGG